MVDIIHAQALKGRQHYGHYLRPGNPGRDGLRDLQEELADAMVYAHERWLTTKGIRYWIVVRLIFVAWALIS